MAPTRPAAPLLLLLLLLLDTGTQAQDEGLESVLPGCPRDATRFKHLRKYMYNYEAESSSGIPGTRDVQSTTKINCKVELEVPQLCSFVLRASQCSLEELRVFSPEGRALLKKTKNSEEFAAAMSRYELKLAISEGKQVVLYPEKDEPKHILNIKRGIISALLAPPETEEDQQVLFLDTVYGNCSTEVTVKTRQGNVATAISTERNLQQCDGFQPIRMGVSPLALIKGLARPLSTLISSNQSCQYTLDSKRKHVSEATCKEQHLFLPFSHKNKYGMVAHVTQTLRLADTPMINSRFFEGGAERVGLAFESTKSTSLPKQAEAVLKTLQELTKLSVSEQNIKRATLFNKLVMELRGLSDEVVTNLLPQLIEVSSPITLQALVQCGQPQCYTHILQWLRSEKAHPLLIDVVTYLVALIPEPSAQRLREVFNTAKEQQSRVTLYALSHVVNNYHKINQALTQDLQDIANYLLEQIRNECMGDEEHTYLILRIIGNMGSTMEKVMPSLKSSVLKCIRSTKPSLLIQKAAIQALRKMELDEEVRRILLQTFVNSTAPVEKRVAAYLMLMRQPSSSDINKIAQLLPWEHNEHVKNFVASHIANILKSEELQTEGLKNLLTEALKESQLPTVMDFISFSRNYHFSKSVSLPSLDPVSAKIEGNLIFDPNNYLPKETMLKTTLTAFGCDAADLFEIGLEGKGFEPTLEALFGKQGFFPDSVNKALYWVNGQVPDHVSKVLMDHFGYTKDDKHEQDMVKGIMPIVDKLINELKSNEIPQARAYLRILGEELGFVRLQDFQLLGRLLLNGARALQGIPQMIGKAMREGSKSDLFLHYIFMDNAFELPTGVGLPLQMSLSGVITPGTKAEVKLELAKMQAELVAKPSVSVEFVTNMGITIPDFARSGIQMNTNFFHESGLEARMALKAGQLKFVIPSPKRPVKLFSGSNTLHLVSTTKMEAIPPLGVNRQTWSTCKPFFPGLNYCTTAAYSSDSSTESASYCPLTGDTRYELELQPSGEVEQYVASATYELQTQAKGLVDTLKFVMQTEGVKQTEAVMLFKYNRRSRTLSSEVQIPDFDVDLGTILRVSDESAEDKKSYKLTLDIQNKKITEVALTGHVSYDRKGEGKIKGVISIPRWQAEARSEVHTHWSSTKLFLRMDSSATAYGSTISKKVAWRYDGEKLEFDWNTGTNVDTRKVASHFPVNLSDYPRSVQHYANRLLDHRIPETDVTFRHMGSKIMVATSTWLQMASRTLPYAQTLQNHLSDLTELSFQKMGLPDFHIPDNLFFKSDGRVKYTLNQNTVKLEIPLPLGGKSSKDLKMLETIRIPAISFKSVGIHLPSQQFQVPTFTIPELYQLQLPLLGVLDLSTNVYSNLYNWSASYTGGNTSREYFSLRARYHMKADSVVDLLSYSVQGSGETTYDYRNTFTLSSDGSLRHKFLDSNVKFSHVEKLGNNPASKGLLTFDASGAWESKMSASAHWDSKKKQHLYVKDVKVDGQFRASSFYATGEQSLTFQKDSNTGQLSGESNLRFNSSYLQGTNQIKGQYQDGILSLASTSDLQDGIFKNTASLKYEQYELTLKSDSNGEYENFVTSHKLDLTFSKQNALLRSESQADYKSLRFFTLLSGSLNSHGVELNADILGTDKINSGAHKATLKIARDGLSTSATTNLKYSPLLLENELNANLGRSGASMKLTTNGRFREHNAKFILDGKAALTEVSLGSVYQAMILGMDGKNVFNFKISQEGLKLSNDMRGSYAGMKLDHANSLKMVGLSLDISSKLDNVYSSDKFYKQNFNLHLEPYALVTTLNNDLKYDVLEWNSNGKLRLEPLKLNVGGNLKGAYRNNEIKHIYTFSYADLSASYQADTVARVQGAEFSHRFNTDIAGLASTVDISTTYNSDSLHFSNIVHSAIAPFTLATDIHTNANGILTLWGEHTGQLYSKFLLKAEPLALTFAHDYKGSTTHHFMSRKIISTALDHKVSALLTPAEQMSTWKFKTQINDNQYSQDFEAYNTKEKLGLEFTGQALTDVSMLGSPIKVPFLLSEPVNVLNSLEMKDAADKPQEFTIVAFIKYDKNQDVHTISLPFLDILPDYLERNRKAIIAVLESIQKELKSINIDQVVRKYRASLGSLPQQVNDYLNDFNWERQVSSAKETLTTFTENYGITENDIQVALDNAKININEKLSELQTYVIQFDQYIKDNYDLHDFKIAIAKIIDQILEKLKILDERYHIRVNLAKTIHDVHLFIENIDFNKIGSSTASWIQNVDTKYQIRIHIQEKLQQLRIQIQNIDIQQLSAKLNQQIEAADVRLLLDQLRTTIEFQRINDIIEHVKYFVMNFIDTLEVTDKINSFRAILHEFLKKYEADLEIQTLVDKLVHLAHQYKLTETVQKLSNVLLQVEIKDYYEKLGGFTDDAMKQLKALSFKKFIEEVNRLLDLLVKKLKSFNYHQFVDDTNNRIREVTQRINSEIQGLELQQKAEALKQFIEGITAMVSDCLERIKNTRVSMLIDWFLDAVNLMKDYFQDTLEDVRDRLYQINIQWEIERYLSLVSQVYNTLVIYISDWWVLAAKNLTDFAEQYSIQDWAENVKALVEHGFLIPEIQTFLGTMPAFKVSLRAFQEATFPTPDFIIPFTDLRVPSVRINFKELRDIKIPSRFATPEFTIFNTFHIPSFTIDLEEIKVKFMKAIDQMLGSEIRWPMSDMYLRDLMMGDISLTGLTLPDFHVPAITIPELIIPNLSLKDFQVADLHIPEFQLPHISNTVAIPAFGKLNGILKIQSPFFSLDANADIQNVTVSENAAEITASITAKGQSKLEALNFDFQAKAQLLEPKINPLALKESMSFSSKYLRMEHESKMLFHRNSIEGKSDTVASLHTEKNTLEFNNSVILQINNQLALDSHTKYFHKLNIPKFDFSSKAELLHEMKTLVGAGDLAWTSSGSGSWKWSCPNFSDEGTHESQGSLTVKGPIASFGLSNKINSKHLRVIQNLTSESGLFDFLNFEAQSEVESQHVGHSVLTARGKASLGERTAEIIGNHRAHLHGKIIGTLKNSLFFSAQPFQMTASTNNEGNLKVSFPLKLTGKIDFLNNYALVLSPHAQLTSWQASARFNQYKYNQNFSATNNENSIEARVGINGDANLDFLNIPLTIPEVKLPYTALTTPALKDFSIWEQTGLKKFFKTTKQSFDLSMNTQYKKNKDKHSIAIPLGAFFEFINQKIHVMNRHFENVRDNALHFLTTSYTEAKIKSDRYEAENTLSKSPRTFQIPGYTIPVANIEVSPFTVETLASSPMIPKAISTPSFTIPGTRFSMPSYTLALQSLQLPILHVPKSLLKLYLPDFKELSTINNIFIPAMGNITYDFSFKSSFMTLNTNAGLYNQSDIVAHFLSSSSFVIDALQYKLEGTSSLTRKRGLKLATALSLNNKYVEGSHDSTISLTKKNMEASVTTNAKVHFPILRMNFKQELNGNTKSKPTISSSIELKYDFSSSKLDSTAKGALDHKLILESLTSYFAIESSTKGDVKGSILSQEYSGTVASEASTYLNSKGSRSSVKLQGASKVHGIWNLEVKENFAGEATLRRIYTIWEHTTKNHLQLKSLFFTSGEHTSKATLELSPWTMSALVQLRSSQPSSLLDIAHFGQEVVLNADTKNQKVSWKSEVQVHCGSLQNNVQLSNDQEEARLDMAGSLEGSLGYLKNIILPVYDKSLLDLLKLNLTPQTGKKQYLHASTSLVYTKNRNGHLFSIPVQELADKFIIPGLKLNYLNSDLVTPMFQVPFTDLKVPSYKFDFSGIEIYKKLSTSPFALNLPMLPKVKFPKVDVITKYSESEDSSTPYFEITVPEAQLTVSKFTLPRSLSLGSSVWDLNDVANKIADFEFPTITMPDQTIEIPSFKFSVPAGIFVPLFGALTASFGVTSPLYNATWSAGLKNKADHVETFLDSTCSSTLQFLEYDLNVVGAHSLEDGAFISKTKGTFAHRDFSADYYEDVRYEGLRTAQEEVRLDIASPAFTDLRLYYQGNEKGLFLSVASQAVGSVGLDMRVANESVKWDVYFHPQSSPDKKLNILKTEWIHPKSGNEDEIKFNWEEEAVSILLSSLKDNVPKAREAFYDYVNKYHQEYTGLSLEEASTRLKRSVQNNAQWSYQGAMRQIDEVGMGLWTAANGTTRTFQEWKDKAQNLYQEVLAEEGQSTFHRCKDKMFDSLTQIIRQYSMAVKHLFDSVIHFMKLRSQLPGQTGIYTNDELCTMVIRKAGVLLSQVYSNIHNGLENLLSYAQNLVEKSDLIKDLKIKGPSYSRSYKLIDIIADTRKQLVSMSQSVQKTFNDLQSVKSIEILRTLQVLLQEVFQNTEKEIKYLRETTLTNFFNYNNMTFRGYIQYSFRFLKKNLYLDFIKFNEFVQSNLQQASQELQLLHQQIKALREEYFDPSIIGQAVKYYELEEKFIDLIKYIADTFTDFYYTYTVTVTHFASQFSIQVEEFMLRETQEYLSILADVDGKGKEKIEELYNTAQEIIKSWFLAIKEIISDYHKQLRPTLQGFSNQLSDYHEKFIAESKRLIDLSIQSYNMVLSYIIELLEKLRSATVSDVSPYISLVPGELTIIY
ncbi:apolipoprotein B-100 [Perognathus longimembris pacificus]|uniref:apolipoprotein B-100 n=1 Tax=Perognathus longimembris pacificus TaxID=214514 RepID=UPI0020199BED|nr:apolipoprotein B-100 [Perognathus longimembris pacificus]